MEGTADGVVPLEAIRPPRLEDAGLEDCALPPEAIQAAFFKAASSVQSRIITADHDEEDDDGCCIEDPGAREKGGSFPVGEEQEAGDDASAVADAGEMEGEPELYSSDAVVVVPKKACEGGDLRRGGDERRKNEEDGGEEGIRPSMGGEALV